MGRFPGVGSHPPSHGIGATSQRRADFRNAFSAFEFALTRRDPCQKFLVPALQFSGLRYISAMQRLKKIFWTAMTLAVLALGIFSA